MFKGNNIRQTRETYLEFSQTFNVKLMLIYFQYWICCLKEK